MIAFNGFKQSPNMKMKKFFVISAVVVLSSPLWAEQVTNTEEAMWDYRGTEMAKQMKQDFSFLEKTMALLTKKGANATKINYMWNPSHTIALFFTSSPPSGVFHCRFWAYQKKEQEAWVKLGEYDFVTRYGMDFDWDSVKITIQNDGYYFSFPDGDVTRSHFFSFAQKQDVFYYRMEK